MPRQPDHLRITAAAWAKFDRHLQDHAAHSTLPPEQDRVPVVVVLDVSAPAEPGRRQKAFETLSVSVRQALARGGASNVLSLWLSNAVAAQVSLSVVADVARDDTVRSVLLDMPRRGLIDQEGRVASQTAPRPAPARRDVPQ